MDVITYKGIDYPTRTFDAFLASEDEDEVQTITVASSELIEALGDGIEVTDSEEEGIDNSIYFYVDADNFYLRADVVCYLHLDEPFVLVEEHKSIEDETTTTR